MSSDDPIKPPANWVDTDKTAERFSVEPSRVSEMRERVEQEAAVELELRTIRRDQELLSYLRAAYDREARARMCTFRVGTDGQPCGAGPWNTITDLIVHVRVHLVLDSGDEKNVRAVLRDIDEMAHPKEELTAKVSTKNVDRDKLLQVVGKGLLRQLQAGPVVPRRNEPVERDHHEHPNQIPESEG